MQNTGSHRKDAKGAEKGFIKYLSVLCVFAVNNYMNRHLFRTSSLLVMAAIAVTIMTIPHIMANKI
jgi:hypothetical protein